MPLKINRSPFFYVGDKYKLMAEMQHYFPKKINKFIEPFTGGGTVFLNIIAKKYVLNDIDSNVITIHKYLEKNSKDPDVFFNSVERIIKKYHLSRSYQEDVVPLKLKKKWKKTYYAKYNVKGYNQLKSLYNSQKQKNPLILYLLLIYGFNRMLRFNSTGNFNIPVGNVDFNKNVKNALIDYFKFVKYKNICWSNKDYFDFLSKLKYERDDFVYIDPPYLISFSEYNKLWNEKEEIKLLKYLDQLNKKRVKFAISNIILHKGKKNDIFIDWMKKYNIYPIKSNYISYHDNMDKKSKEVLVTNYDCYKEI